MRSERHGVLTPWKALSTITRADRSALGRTDGRALAQTLHLAASAICFIQQPMLRSVVFIPVTISS